MTGSRLVELCSSTASTQRVGSTLDVTNDQVPTDCAEIEILVLIIRMLEHAAGVDLALARAASIDDCFFELMMPVSPEAATWPNAWPIFEALLDFLHSTSLNSFSFLLYATTSKMQSPTLTSRAAYFPRLHATACDI
jgi:hypothetical protein